MLAAHTEFAIVLPTDIITFTVGSCQSSSVNDRTRDTWAHEIG
jgi:hypothetical protein